MESYELTDGTYSIQRLLAFRWVPGCCYVTFHEQITPYNKNQDTIIQACDMSTFLWK